MKQEKKIQLYDLLIVLAVTILPAIISGILIFIVGEGTYSQGRTDASIFFAIVKETIGIFLLLYVLFNRDKTLKNLGVSISWKDLLFGVALFVTATIIYTITYYITKAALPPALKGEIIAKNVSNITKQFSWCFLAFVIINPFFEELIVRGFTITQVFSLTNSKVLTIIISVVLQCSYHIYQGVVPMIMMSGVFFLFSVFYIKTGRLTPILIAHLIFDLLILTKI